MKFCYTLHLMEKSTCLMMKCLILPVFFLLSPGASGQSTGFTVGEIDSIVTQTNSTCISGGITDYSFHKKGQRKKTIGGGADWFYTDASGKKLLKVVRETSLDTETMDTYYFYNDSLIYLATSNATYTGGVKKINWHGNYYFNNSVLLSKQDDLKYPFKPEMYLRTARQFFAPDQIWRR
jgi:hypothetical protein